MKGRFYNTTASLKAEVNEKAIPKGTFTFGRKQESKKKRNKISIRSAEKSPIRFLWKSSIPNGWEKIAPPLEHIKDEKGKTRNTLSFLEETQKYIFNICKPMKYSKEKSEAVLSPTKLLPISESLSNSPTFPKLASPEHEKGVSLTGVELNSPRKMLRKSNSSVIPMEKKEFDRKFTLASSRNYKLKRLF